MGEVALILLGVVLGIAGDEAYSSVKSRVAARRMDRRRRRLEQSADPVRHATHLLEIFRTNGLTDRLVRTTTTLEPALLPMVHDQDDRLVGDLTPESDAPLRLLQPDRVELPYRSGVIERKQHGGVTLWDGSLLYALGEPVGDDGLAAGVCNYYAYVDLSDRILHESDEPDGAKPLLLGTFRSFDDAISGSLRPIVISAAATCVFEGADGRRQVTLQRRSDRVVTSRGMYAVAPVFGLEPNVLGTSRSRFGLVTYNVLKEILEEFFDEEELSRAADQPGAAHPDWIFRSEHGRRLVAELDVGRLRLRCTGAAIDISDGSVILAVLAHFTSPAYADELKLTARGSWESATTGGPRIEFAAFDGPELTALMTAGTMTASSIFALDRARAELGAGPSR
ncbi:hypothetical protein E1262_21640 [Jiangella aurantiaca]|uniref:Uncharacterized protein n=1 Tax=Jiangella aurantiaca TaxID=2530373 RepID=A0A4R5A6F1_9ACTN|nr:hypothetical protein [Jiangella aurantiaca]TDD66616.1 hypothetical protein E1262_21640 [Jiangella aurantiaca]